MRPALLAAAVLAAAVLAPVGSPHPATNRFSASVAPLDAAQRARMTGVSWRPGCPVRLGNLRLVTVSHWGFDGRLRRGRLVVHRDVAETLVAVFRRLHADRFAIRRMVPVDAFGGSDFRSIEADNTSAFNCRYVDGTRRWSEHAYGRAIDVNPIENPYVAGGRTSHAASRAYLDRSVVRPGMAVPDGPLVTAFRTAGWGWGGDWGSARDYQHFSASGR